MYTRLLLGLWTCSTDVACGRPLVGTSLPQGHPFPEALHLPLPGCTPPTQPASSSLSPPVPEHSTCASYLLEKKSIYLFMGEEALPYGTTWALRPGRERASPESAEIPWAGLRAARRPQGPPRSAQHSVQN